MAYGSTKTVKTEKEKTTLSRNELFSLQTVKPRIKFTAI